MTAPHNCNILLILVYCSYLFDLMDTSENRITSNKRLLKWQSLYMLSYFSASRTCSLSGYIVLRSDQLLLFIATGMKSAAHFTIYIYVCVCMYR